MSPSYDSIIIIVIINIIIVIVIINLLILVVVSLVCIRLDRECEEVEPGLVADEQGQGAVPPIPRVSHRILEEYPRLADPEKILKYTKKHTNPFTKKLHSHFPVSIDQSCDIFRPMSGSWEEFNDP